MHQTMSSASSYKSLEGWAISGECDLAILRSCYLNMKKQRFVCRVVHVQMHMHVRWASICRPSVQTANCGLLISRRAACVALIECLNEFQTSPECQNDTSTRHSLSRDLCRVDISTRSSATLQIRLNLSSFFLLDDFFFKHGISRKRAEKIGNPLLRDARPRRMWDYRKRRDIRVFRVLLLQ